MRVISQNGRIDIPYDYFSLSMSCAKIARGKVEDRNVFSIVCHNLSSPNGTKLAEYSTEEKANKAMEMLRKSYVGSIVMFQNVEPTDELKEMLKIHGIEAIYAILDNQPQEIKFENHQNFYFQFPTEEELE